LGEEEKGRRLALEGKGNLSLISRKKKIGRKEGGERQASHSTGEGRKEGRRAVSHSKKGENND